MINLDYNLSNTLITYKYQLKESSQSTFLVNILEKTENFLNIIEDFYDN